LTQETHKLVARMGGRSAVSRIDAIFFAKAAAEIELVGHIRHMAQAFKYAAERVPGAGLRNERQGVVFRDALLMRRASLEPVLDKWLRSLDVVRLDTETPLIIKPDGSAIVVQGDEGYEIGQTVLADDAAIAAHVSEEIWPQLLQTYQASSVLTEATAPLPAALMYQLDSGIVLSQHARSGLVTLGPGSIEQVSGKLGQFLEGQRTPHAGQSNYQRLRTLDHAPAVGRIGGVGSDIVAGFGLSGSFWAPAIARWLAGVGSAEENAWFAARLINRDPASSSVSEWAELL
jgi:hypothetical protein